VICRSDGRSTIVRAIVRRKLGVPRARTIRALVQSVRHHGTDGDAEGTGSAHGSLLRNWEL